MCGIAGFVGPGDEGILRKMTDRIRYRGPDAEGFLVEPDCGVYLGHRRLAILDIAGGAQPMTTEDGACTIVFNGEIYNFAELRNELVALGCRFQSDHSDTEVLLHGYRQWGDALPLKLNGMWALALFDRNAGTVFFSCDRFGKKPLYYYASPHGFVFASELAALHQHPDVPRSLDARSLRKYYAYGFVPAPLTFYENVRKLAGGTSMTLDIASMSVRTSRYWAYRAEPFEHVPRNAAEVWGEELIERLDTAVRRRLVADVPVGMFLSGGIDSSLLSALAIRHAGRDKVHTFSIGFDEATFDESHYAQLVAEHIGAHHLSETISVRDVAKMLPSLLENLDEPIADSSLLPTYLLCRFVRQHVTVALGGDGADELFAGYAPFRALRYARWYRSSVPKPVHRAISVLAARMPVSHRYMSLDFKLKRTLRGLDHATHLQLPIWMSPVSPEELREMFGDSVDLEDIYSEAIAAWDDGGEQDPVDRASAFYIRLYLQDDILVKVDRTSMLNSLEVRAPFLDCDFVDFVRRLPADFKFRNGTTKWLLRQVAKRMLPREIVERSKQGFALPLGRWFCDDAIAPLLEAPMQFDALWRSKLAEHRSLKADHRLYLWAELVLSRVLQARSREFEASAR
ncbi:MAG: asparagine synthase (glutamine-hydrolyzing) [Luteimonas sp.]